MNWFSSSTMQSLKNGRRSFLVPISNFTSLIFKVLPVDYFEKLEVRQAHEAKRRKNERNENTGSNKNQGNRNKDKSETSKQQSKYKKCTHCGRTNHVTKDCWFSPENKGKSKPGRKSSDKTVMMTVEQLNTILKLLPRNPKSGARKVRAFSPVQSDTENVTMFGPKTKISKVDNNRYSDEDSIYLDCPTNCKSSFHYDENSPKRQKLSHKTTEVVKKVHGTAKNGMLHILLDTGASATIILKDAIRDLTGPVLKEQPTTWNTV